ncbi:DUF2147 domain-containing protein [Chelatococcus sp. XZ-Ab1]|uniref:DUF2147 domain-containing protein n=1 Tax=Chelatococcus sp. XZ-Ab1 TaxID=3034027 RepID=UPI0023E3C6E0|nr:DUF2147 domain-containing protein [Chelatococcus sp. XZ-Ab1]
MKHAARSLGTNVASLAGLIGLTLAAPAASAQEVNGQWLTQGGKARVNIASCGAKLCGTIVWLREPNDEAGQPKRDERNVDASKRNRPLIGVPVLLGMSREDSGRWKGEIYNAEDGKTYTAFLTPVSATEVKVEGCVMGGLICKEQRWTRAR